MRETEEYVELNLHHPVVFWVMVIVLGAILTIAPNLDVSVTEFLFWGDDGHMAVAGMISVIIGLCLVAFAAMRLAYYAKEH